MYPVRFEVDYVEPRNRLTTFFRLFMAFPHFIVLGVLAIAGFVAVVVAWFALLISGQWPAGLYGFVSGVLRYGARVTGYLTLLTDEYPPFDLGEHPEYPVRLHVDPPLPEYSRLKVLLRGFYVLPAYILQYALTVLAEVIAFVAWFVIVFTGKQSRELHNLIVLGDSYYARSSALFALVTETYPPISEQPQQLQAPPPAPPIQQAT